MAQLKDTLIQGSARVTDTLYGSTVELTSLVVPSTTNSSTYSSGSAGQVLKSNGSSVYWDTMTPDQLNLANAMHFIGKATTTITDGGDEDPGITGYSPVPGDVVISSDDHREYVWTLNNHWEILGGDSSYKIIQQAVNHKPKENETNKWISEINQNENGEITVGYTSLETSGQWNGKAATAGTADQLNHFVVSTYNIQPGKGVRIQYPTNAPVLISVQRGNSGGRLILLGGGYGAEATKRNDFTEVVSCSNNMFGWSLPNSTSISYSIEIMQYQTSGEANVIVWSKAACTFTEITALTSPATNRVLLHTSNYTNYTVTKIGEGASGTWGISITGTAANVTDTVAIANGGTGAESFVSNSLIVSGGNNSTKLTTLDRGTEGYYLISGGANAVPHWTAPVSNVEIVRL